METNEWGSRIALDIESVPHERADDWYSGVSVKAPSNYKDEAKIKAYVDAARAKLGQKAALSWHTGKVLSFAVADVKTNESLFFWGLDEVKVLDQLELYCTGRTIYAKSGKLFDYPFLIGRYMANKMPVPRFLKSNETKKDVDDFFSYSNANPQRGSLQAYAHGLNIAGKDGDFSIASKVYYDSLAGLLSEDDVKKLETYNKQDALIVADMVRRYEGA